MSFVKSVIVYADGTVKESKSILEGAHWIETEMVNGDMWRRTFDVDCARRQMPGQEPVLTFVAVERDFVLSRTREQLAADRAEWDARTMKAALWGIANYPGDADT